MSLPSQKDGGSSSSDELYSLGMPQISAGQDLELNTKNWGAIKSSHLLAHSSFIKMKFASGDVHQRREALERYCFIFTAFKNQPNRNNPEGNMFF